MQMHSERSSDLASPLRIATSGLVLSGSILLVACLAVALIVHRGTIANTPTWQNAQVVLGLLALLAMTSLSLTALRRRDHRFPFFDVGVVCLMVTTLYFVVPLLNFLAGGMTFTLLSDNRLFVYNPSAQDLSPLVWGSVVYLGGFSMVYLIARGKGYPLDVAVARPRQSRMVSVVALWALLALSITAIEIVYGVSFSPSYRDLRTGEGLITQLPYYLQQIMHNVRGMYHVAKQALLIIVFLYWKKLPIRIAGIIWLLSEIVWSVVRQGERTDVVLLLLTAALLYHRMVRALTFPRVAFGGCVLLVGVFVAGFMRDISLDVGGIAATDVSVLSAANEFQSLFGTAYDLHERQARGQLAAIPWTLYASEVLQLIPSQVLPFQKVGPADWYLELLDLRGSQVGFMFGVLSQGVVGGGWVELLGRGVVLAGALAGLHRWYVRRASSFNVTLVYVFMCVWSYYTVRATTFYAIYFLIYRLGPFMLAVMIGERLLSAARPRKNS